MGSETFLGQPQRTLLSWPWDSGSTAGFGGWRQERCRVSVWDNVWSKGHPLAGNWELLPSLHVVESTSTACWDGTI